ncbi:MAG TPA: asparagine synthase-related protein [Acidimicrobiia bacterium]
MCGIAGIQGVEDDSVVDTMLAGLRHRGPDDEGTHTSAAGVLGHRRLSIVDLDGGHQPILDASGTRALVANGEIYNAPSLRARLTARHDFASQSDSEVALHLHADHGPDAPRHLAGMFAIAIADDDDLLLMRDPVGIKPLYLGAFGGGTVFASELKVMPPGTTEVAPLPPGCTWSSSAGVTRYHEIRDPEPVTGDLERHTARVRRALEESVQSLLMADVPVGAFLSGGLDSSAIAALARPHVDRLHTFSVGLEGSPDLAAARAVAEHLDTDHHELVLRPDDIVAALPRIVAALESFDQDLVRSAVPTWFCAELAARHVKVILTGEGADELFAGYRYHRNVAAGAGPDGLRAELHRSVNALHDVNLQRVDRMTMAHSLEARVPFLEVPMIETGLSVPVEHKLPAEGPEKLVLRRAVADLLPADVVWRVKAQFDEGTGTADLLPDLVAEAAGGLDPGEYAVEHGGDALRSREECLYHQLLVAAVPDPAVVLPNVGRWSHRPAPVSEPQPVPTG